MAQTLHEYAVETIWNGADQGPAETYAGYSRDHIIRIDGKPDLLGSSDPGFRGDASRHNPEDLLVASLSACHMLWYLHLCTVEGISVHSYQDAAQGIMEETSTGGGRFTSVTLRPKIQISPANKKGKAIALHKLANEKCFIANSVNFPVTHDVDISVAD